MHKTIETAMFSPDFVNPYADDAPILRNIDLSRRKEREAVNELLVQHGLRITHVTDFLGYFNNKGKLIACGGLDGDTIKLLAVEKQWQGSQLAALIVTQLMQVAMNEGIRNVRVFTRPTNRNLFQSMGFTLIASAPEAIFLERDAQALPEHLRKLREIADTASPGRKVGAGVIVMNCNPFTLGHRYLIHEALKRLDATDEEGEKPPLFVILLGDNPHTRFPQSDRRAMVEASLSADGLTHRVQVIDGNRYAISQATFPTYFLKKTDDATDIQIQLDLQIFCRHIAPALGVTRRFVGTEPLDVLTARYNELMQQLLPKTGIVVEVIDRMVKEQPVSASRVRRWLDERRIAEAFSFVPPTTHPYLLAEQAGSCLMAELRLSPKPGLVDRYDNGAHKDMDFKLMERSVKSLWRTFTKIARSAYAAELPTTAELLDIGRKGEADMLKATGGVNTHKGALFAMGLALAAASHLCHERAGLPQVLPLDARRIQQLIRQIAAGIPRAANTHGTKVHHDHGLPSALDHARSGYPQLFDEWLPDFPLPLPLPKKTSALSSTSCQRFPTPTWYTAWEWSVPKR